MSTLVVATLKSNSSSPPAFQNTSGTEIGKLCRAWVNFNGVTPAIRTQYNVSSITDLGSGQNQVNFLNALPDADYCYIFGGKPSGDTIAGFKTDFNQSNTTTYLRVTTGSATAAYDFTDVCVAIFR